MRGLYINASMTSMPKTAAFTAKYSEVVALPELNGCLVYSSKEWPEAPIATVENHTLYLAGWFIYKGQRNNLSALLTDLAAQGTDVLAAIEAGSFIALWQYQDELRVINDPFGLSTHYIDKHSQDLRIAPAVTALLNDHQVDPDMQNVLQNKSHLFGNYTLYEGIERIEPGSVTTITQVTKYIDLSQAETLALTELTDEMATLAQYWPKKERVLPLSSGMDSRLLLAATEFEYGFTYGPEGCPERQIAGQYQDLFEHYYGYEYEQGLKCEDEAEITAEMAAGVLTPIAGLLGNYSYVSERFENASAFFDGYLGDVLQRGTYVTPKGVKGELLKLFPWLYKFIKLAAEDIIVAKYAACGEGAKKKVVADFKDKTAHLSLTDFQKVTYYEFLYGRGGRYTIFGSNVLAAQCFSVVSPFATVKIFASYIQQDFSDAVMYKLLKPVWQHTRERFSQAKVESGYTPLTPYWVIPPIQLFYRVLFHLMPSRANYGIKLKREQKKRAKK